MPHPRLPRRRVLGELTVLLVVLILALGIVGFRVSNLIVKVPPTEGHPVAGISEVLAAAGLEAEPLQALTPDGLLLRGALVTAPGAERAVILCHGHGTNRGDVAPLAPAFARAGFHVCLLDFRAHGQSDRCSQFGFVGAGAHGFDLRSGHFG